MSKLGYMNQTRRAFAGGVAAVTITTLVSKFMTTTADQKTGGGEPQQAPDFPLWEEEKWASLSENEWKKRLSTQAFRVLRKHATEQPFTSPLNEQKNKGWYACAGCGLVLFSSEHKYDSGTGWPSFWKPVEGRYGTKRDFKLLLPRTEYHCKRCHGHQGHVFSDGPPPTGKRWCNNGVALLFFKNGQT